MNNGNDLPARGPNLEFLMKNRKLLNSDNTKRSILLPCIGIGTCTYDHI